MIKSINKKKITVIIFFVLACIFTVKNIYAEEKQNNVFGGFSVEGVPNSNQIDKNSGYFF
ncbi:hypothetical protein F6334_RS14305, partial [Enterococcus hirae]